MRQTDYASFYHMRDFDLSFTKLEKKKICYHEIISGRLTKQKSVSDFIKLVLR